MNILQGIAQPEQLSEFRKYHNPNANVIDIPLPLKDRRVTNITPLIFFIICNIVLVLCLVHSLEYADINRRYGFDNCGNVCGIKNAHNVFPCTGKDFTKEKYLVINQNETFSDIYRDELPGLWPCERYCAASCPDGYETIVHMCIATGKNEHKDLAEWMEYEDDIIKAWWAIALSVAITLCVTFLFMVIFINCVSVVVWFNLGALVAVLILAVVYFWYSFASGNHNEDDKKSALILACIATVVLVILLFCCLCMFEAVELIIQLFKEAAKAVKAMPWMVLVPVLGALSEIILVSALIIAFLLLFTSGILIEIIPHYYYYYAFDPIILVTFPICFFMFIWYYLFIAGCQYMIVAGATSTWFFASDKAELNSPIFTATVALIRFHLGTVALGSLVITITAIIREMIKGIEKSEEAKFLCDKCIGPGLQDFVEFMSKQAYIQTAMHGEPYFRSGKRAAKLLLNNIVDIIFLNSIGDIILFVSLLFVLVTCTIIATTICERADVKHHMAPGIIAMAINFAIILSFFEVFETIIDVIFICFCEDQLLNDGVKKPYAMSKDLMMFIERSKELIKPEEEA